MRCVFRVPGLQVRFGRVIESSGENRLSAGTETGPTPNTYGAWSGVELRELGGGPQGLTLHCCYPGSGTADVGAPFLQSSLAGDPFAGRPAVCCMDMAAVSHVRTATCNPGTRYACE